MTRILLVVLTVLLLQACGGEQQMNLEQQLFDAVEQNDTTKVQQLIAQQVDINAIDEQRRSPLMVATYRQLTEVATQLIEAGANVNQQDNMLNSPFLYAGAEGYIDLLTLMLDAEVDPTVINRYGGTALIPASEHGDVETVQLLLERTTVDVNHVNDLGWTALLEAIILGDGSKTQQQVVALLIKHGADIHLADDNGVTPLVHANQRGYKAIAQQLVKAGAKR